MGSSFFLKFGIIFDYLSLDKRKVVFCLFLPCSGSSRSEAGISNDTCDISDREVLNESSLNSLALLLRDLDPFLLFLLPFRRSFTLPFLFGVFGFSDFFFGFSGVSVIGKGNVILDTEERLEGGR